MNDKISVVVPVYMGEAFVDELYERVRAAVLSITGDWELILVNDASPDGAWKKIEAICAKDRSVIGINLSRNFGQHAAITAGLAAASGGRIVVMDCDLQDVPEDIPALVGALKERNADAVLGRRVVRKDSFFKRLSSSLFASVYGYLTDAKLDAAIANFGAYNRKVVNAVLSMRDAHKNFPLFVRWVGFKTAAIPVTHAARPSGKSSYSFRKLVRFAFDSILSFSDKPLRLMVFWGFSLASFSFLVGLCFFLLGLFGRFNVLGYASLIVSIWFFAGVQLFFLGVVGIYISKTFNQTKERPIYIVERTLNAPAKKSSGGELCEKDDSGNSGKREGGA